MGTHLTIQLLRKKDDDTTGEDDIASIRQDALTLVSRDTRDIDIDISGECNRLVRCSRPQAS